MTQKAKVIIDSYRAEQFALRDKVAARLAKLNAKSRLEVMVSAGILTKRGKLTPVYRSKPATV